MLHHGIFHWALIIWFLIALKYFISSRFLLIRSTNLCSQFLRVWYIIFLEPIHVCSHKIFSTSRYTSECKMSFPQIFFCFYCSLYSILINSLFIIILNVCRLEACLIIHTDLDVWLSDLFAEFIVLTALLLIDVPVLVLLCYLIFTSEVG
jgi:hypothetical protein